MENKNWPDDVRLKMIEKSEFYPDDKQVYQYGFYDGFQYAMQAYHEAANKQITDEDISKASTELKTEENGCPLPGEIKTMNEEFLRIGFIIGARYVRDGEIKHIEPR
jgi:hypothetical protein